MRIFHPDDDLTLRDWLRENRRPAWTMVALMVIAHPLILALDGGQWFFLDEWDFLADRDGGDPGDLLRFHFDHPSIIPILAYRIVWQFAGLTSYLPYQVWSVLTHVLSAGLLWLIVARRVHVRPWVALLAVTPYLLLGTGWQNIVWAFQIGLVGSMVFGFAQLYIASNPYEISRKDYVGVVFGILAIGCSGVGVTTTAVAGLAALISRGWKPALLHTVPVGAVFLLWYATYGPEDTTPTAVWTTDMIEMVVIAYQEVFLDQGWWTINAYALAMLLVGGLVLAWRNARSTFHTWRVVNASAIALALGGLGFIAVTAYGRAGFFGVRFGASSRYTHILVASLVPLLAIAIDAILKRWRTALPVVLVIALAGVVPNLDEFRDRSREALFLAGPENMIHALADAVAADPTIADGTRPLPERAQHVTVGWLRDIIADEDVELGREVPARVTNEAAYRLQLGVHQIPLDVSDLECEQMTEPEMVTLEPGEPFTVSLGTVRFRQVLEDPDARSATVSVNSFFDSIQLWPNDTLTVEVIPVPNTFGPLRCA
ncbi:MAG: hypothetical protein AAF548_00730 [Actinomycetota bacterium]